MLLLPGSVALSAPRFSRLSAQITELDPTLTLKRAFFIYAVDAAVDLGRPQIIYLIHCKLSEGMNLSCRDVTPLLFRQGVTPADIYGYLRNCEDPKLRTQGSCYIRAESIGVGGVRTVLKKDQALDDRTNCVKIFTNRVRAWQNQGSAAVGAGQSSKQKAFIVRILRSPAAQSYRVLL